MICTIDFCSNVATYTRKTLCKKHYERIRTTGKPSLTWCSEATGKCIQCDKDISHKGIYCSSRCRERKHRNIKEGYLVCIVCDTPFITKIKSLYCSIKCCKKAIRLKNKYNLSVEEYKSILNTQNNLCAICDSFLKEPCIDHDHSTGKVRGILCTYCNVGLGYFRDNPKNLNKAILYLSSSQ